jgi:hypothetical protein
MAKKVVAQAMKIRAVGDRWIVCDLCGWDEMLPKQIDVWSVWQLAQRHWDARHALGAQSNG